MAEENYQAFSNEKLFSDEKLFSNEKLFSPENPFPDGGSSISLRISCITGKLTTARWINDHFNNITSIEIRKDNNEILRTTCKNGHVDTARWIYLAFNFTKDDVRISNDEIIINAIEECDDEMLEWATIFGEYTEEEVRTLKALYPPKYIKNACCPIFSKRPKKKARQSVASSATTF